MMSTQESKAKIKNILERLISLGGELREALLSRDPERIQEVTLRQDVFKEGSLDLYSAPEGGWQEDEDVSRLAEHLRKLQESNRLLANTFLSIYRNTFASLSPLQGAPGVYGRQGTLTAGPALSVLVKQVG